MTLQILAFFAHPDDETMLCGGTLALLARQGADVNILIATRGEGGEMGEPPLTTRENLGMVRESELSCAAKALGARLTVLDYIDPVIGPGDVMFPFTDDVERLVVQLVDAIRDYGINAVISHGVNGEYGHPAHKLVYRAVERAVQVLGEEAPLFYTVQGMFPDHPYPRLANEDTQAHLVLDISPVMDQKVEAALCHATQHALFVRFWSEAAGRLLTVPEVVMNLESLHRVWPEVPAGETPQDALADLLRETGTVRVQGEA